MNKAVFETFCGTHIEIELWWAKLLEFLHVHITIDANNGYGNYIRDLIVFETQERVAR